jgi:hypothetical protein
MASVVNRDPCPTVVGVAGENLDGDWFHVCDVVQPVVAKLLDRSALDVAEGAQILSGGQTD